MTTLAARSRNRFMMQDMTGKRNTRKISPLLAGAATLLLAVGMLAGGVADAATPAATGDYQTYDAADSQLVEAMDAVNASVKAKSDADAAAAQAATDAQAQAQAAQSQSTLGSSSGASAGSGRSYSGGGYRAPSYTPAPSYQAPAPAAPSVPANSDPHHLQGNPTHVIGPVTPCVPNAADNYTCDY